MALTNLKDVEVVSRHQKGYGVRVLEIVPTKDSEKKRYWTVWFKDESGLEVGQKVSISGFLDASVSDPFEGSDGNEYRAVNFSLQSPRLNDVQSAPAVNSEWATPATQVAEEVEPF